MNRNVLALLLRPAPGQNSVLALPVVAFAVVTMLVLTVIGGAQSFWGWTDEIAPSTRPSRPSRWSCWWCR